MSEMRSRRGTPDFEHEDLQSFLESSTRNGWHAINYKGLPIDLQIVDRNAPTTLVVFHGAVPKAYKRLPVFSGNTMASDWGTNLVAIADPSLVMGPTVHLGWYLGNRWQGSLRSVLTSVISHVLGNLGTVSTLFFGPSGGAFPATQQSLDFKSINAFLVNPRLDLMSEPLPASRIYLQECHKALSHTPRTRIWSSFVPEVFDLQDREGFGANRYIIYPNLGDVGYCTGQLIPFLKRNLDAPNVLVFLNDDGGGHVPIPREHLDYIGNLLVDQSQFDDGILNETSLVPPAKAVEVLRKRYPQFF